jgi:2-polyprenyl-3-methyl-5-hydroxy-6-metoxy-1,4-benzoquinol methylase
MEFSPHDVTWNMDKIAHIWDFYTVHENDYFSQTMGDSILKTVRRKIPLKGKVLDFGCGSGHFLEKLLKKKIYTAGFDLSKESLQIVEKKLRSNPFFLGTFHSFSFPTSLSDDSYDVIFFIETIEHILPDQRDSILRELHRILKKGGHIVATTRNQENLEIKKVICPDCGCIYHRKQHLSSFSESSLASLMAAAGFSAKFCRPVLFSVSKMTWMRKLYLKMAKEKMPDLLFIGRKA